MSYPEIEKQLVAQLEPLKQKTGLLITALPDIPNQWGSNPGIGWVVIRWVGNRLDKYSIGERTAIEMVDYQLDIRVQQMKEGNSLYLVVNELKRLLWGFQPDLCHKAISYGNVSFLGTLNDYWLAQATMTAYVYAGMSQLAIDYSQFPLFTDVDYQPLGG